MVSSSSSSSSFSLRVQTHFRPRSIPTLLPARRREVSSQFVTHPTARFISNQESIPGHIPKKQIIKEEQGEDREEKKSLRIGILGFGNFGQFIAKRMVRQGHEVMATSRRDYSAECRRDGVQFFKSVEEMCAQKPDVVLVCTSILSTESVLRSVPFHLLKPDTIFADVLSVKQYPRNLFLEIENLDRAFDAVKQKLFGRLHDILRKQIMERAPLVGGSSSSAAAGPSFLLKNGDIRDVASFAAAPPSESAAGITDYRSPNALVS